VVLSYCVFSRGFDLAGCDVVIEGEGWLVWAFFHEIDHLDGILFVDKLSALKRALIRKKIKKRAAAAQKT